MTAQEYEGRIVIIKSTGNRATIQHILRRRNTVGIMSIRFIVKDEYDRFSEMMPHEVDVTEDVTNDKVNS